MNTIFVDSSSFVALHNSSDALHKKATKILHMLLETNARLVTATNIIMESATIISQKADHKTAIAFLEFIKNGEIKVTHPNEETMLHAEDLFINQTSKNVSYSDCISFAVMKEQNITHAFSFDEDFKKNGFTLLK